MRLLRLVGAAGVGYALGTIPFADLAAKRDKRLRAGRIGPAVAPAQHRLGGAGGLGRAGDQPDAGRGEVAIDGHGLVGGGHCGAAPVDGRGLSIAAKSARATVP